MQILFKILFFWSILGCVTMEEMKFVLCQVCSPEEADEMIEVEKRDKIIFVNYLQLYFWSPEGIIYFKAIRIQREGRAISMQTKLEC